jgi:hypothetical protein
MADSELDSFKTSIDLRAYATVQGYSLDRAESWRGSTVRRHINGDKIVVKIDMDGHYVYYSFRDDRDHGSIIDFIAKRRDLNLGKIRKELRSWSGQPPTALPSYPALLKTGKDRVRVERAFAGMRDASDHPYLENVRKVPGALLKSERFAGRIRIDRGNAVFPHFDAQGLCGYEIKNAGFTGFASGGNKGLWMSHERPDDNRLVFCESAIDALSHAALFPHEQTRYASVGGKLSPVQLELIRAAAARMPANSEIMAAMDADDAGWKLAEAVRKAVAETNREDLRFSIEEPLEAKDWNDQLRAMSAQPLPFPR